MSKLSCEIRIALLLPADNYMLSNILSYLSASRNHAPVKLNLGINLNLSVRMLWAVGIITVIFTYVNMSQIMPNDFWWHMAVGREIITSGQIPTVDVYSHTMAGQPYPSYQMFWLMDIWLYAWYSLGGPELILFIQSLIITGAYLITLASCWGNSKKWGVTSLCLFFAILLGIYAWNVRPQAISFLIGAVFIYAIYTYRRSLKSIWLVVFPLGMLVWVNSHGSFPIGLLLLSIWVGDEIWQVYLAWRVEKQVSLKRLITPSLVLFVTIGVCLVNPRGIGIISYLLSMTSNPAVQNTVPEWAPPSTTSPIGPIYFASLLFTALVLALPRRRPTFFQLGNILAFAVLGLLTTRGVVWFGLVAAPILADHLSLIGKGNPANQKPSLPTLRERRINFAILFLLLSLAGLSLPWFRGLVPIKSEYRSLITRDTPVEAAEFLVEQQSAGKIFNDIVFGSYFIWSVYPEYQVFSDPRIELFSQEIWDDYQVISRAEPGWEQKLVEYGIRTLVLNPDEQGQLVDKVKNSGKWRLIYRDETAVIYSVVPLETPPS